MSQNRNLLEGLNKSSLAGKLIFAKTNDDENQILAQIVAKQASLDEFMSNFQFSLVPRVIYQVSLRHYYL